VSLIDVSIIDVSPIYVSIQSVATIVPWQYVALYSYVWEIDVAYERFQPPDRDCGSLTIIFSIISRGATDRPVSECTGMSECDLHRISSRLM
jgi:hypothetical protein